MRVKNNTQAQDTWCGQQIQSLGEYDIQASELFKWQADSKVLSDISNSYLLVGDGQTYKQTPSEALNYLLGIDTTPKDISGRPIQRFAATIDGWHYQLLSTEITTAKLGGYYSKDENGQDLGFVTYKIYDSNDAEITDAQNETSAVKTVVWIRPTHSYEIIGAIFGQNTQPTDDVRLWVTGLPGIANIRFSRGGINLKYASVGAYQLADGRASKYLSYNAQMPDLNSFKITLTHPQGVKHSFQVSFEIYKAP